MKARLPSVTSRDSLRIIRRIRSMRPLGDSMIPVRGLRYSGRPLRKTSAAVQIPCGKRLSLYFPMKMWRTYSESFRKMEKCPCG